MKQARLFFVILSAALPLTVNAKTASLPNSYSCSPNLRHECNAKKCETLTDNVNGSFYFNKKTSLLTACLGSACHSGKAAVLVSGKETTATAKVKDKKSSSELIFSLTISQNNEFSATWAVTGQSTTIDMGMCKTKF